MAELKDLTVRALRELARKALGRGHSRLRTKRELVAALEKAGKGVSRAAGRAAKKVRRAADRVEGAARAAERAVDAVTTATARRRRKRPAAAEPPSPRTRRDEPDAEGHFVARVRGEEAAREAPHPMTEGALHSRPGAEPRRAGLRPEHAFEENLGELPSSYGDDAFLALPRDPRTLCLYWDHHGETLKRGFEGLSGGHAQLWIFAQEPDGDWRRVRVVDFALESKSYFVHDLEPGRVYRAEIHLVDRAGSDKVLSSTSNAMQLPPFGPSAIVEDRFLRIPWNEPLTRLLGDLRHGGAFPDELRAMLSHLSDWSRFVAPTWGGSGSGAGPGGEGGPGGRPSGPSGGLGLSSSPSSPWGAWSANGSGSGRR